ncbi:MAG: prephenate dehydrogenase [Clostridia bacterium]|nr:prephenate dehydrogenase [Clostridia bacterium]
MKISLQLKETNMAIVGTGLMGGSILKSLAGSEKRPKKISALDNDIEVLKKIKNLKLADYATDNAQEALFDADLVVISLYPAQAIKFIRDNGKFLKDGCIVTDICGVKREVIDTIPMLLPEGVLFVGGHPMAGREHKGFDCSTSDLFLGCKYIVDEKDSEGKALVKEFAMALGAGQIVESSARNHDELIAYTSQLPHVLAVAYMLCAGERNVDEFSAGSFRDVTRVAMINDEMWSELFNENKDMLVDEIAALRKGLLELEELISDSDTEKMRDRMKKAAQMRESVHEIKKS